MKQIKISVTFESEEEKQLALKNIKGDYSDSDKGRIAFGLKPRNKKAGAPKGNKNNPHGRRKREEI